MDGRGGKDYEGRGEGRGKERMGKGEVKGKFSALVVGGIDDPDKEDVILTKISIC